MKQVMLVVYIRWLFLLFDNDSMWHSWIDNPMNIAREISFCHGDLLKDFTEIFSLKETLTNQHIIENFKRNRSM